jgi:hypothetical protein
MMMIIASIAAAYAFAAVGVLVVMSRERVAGGLRSEAAFWAVACLVCVLLVAGALPWFWQLPFAAKVQFPWRLMIVVEFAGITALCLMPWPLRTRAMSYLFVVAIIALIPGLGEMGTGIVTRAQVSRIQPDPPADLKQFLPAGYPQKPRGGYAELSLGPVEDLPTISCAPEPRLCRATNQPLGELMIEIDADAPTAVVLRRFAYPFWRLEPALPVAATDPLRLVSFTAPAGRQSYRLVHMAVPAEQIGWAISGISLVLLLGWAMVACRRIQPA